MTATYLGFAAAVAVLIASPGPVVALVVADARLRWPLWTILGGVTAALILLTAALLLIHLALDLEPFILEAGQVLGGLYLIGLGAGGLLRESETSPTQGSEAHYFWRALMVGLSNPKDILFFLAFLPTFISPKQPLATQATALIAIWISIDLSILLAYSLLSRHLSGSRRAAPMLRILPNLCLLGLGLGSCALGIASLMS
ncbi:LysE family translocator [Pseudomonas saudiphocaensis]|uniref:LysE family translocator n=1 Tax=Pseudomonas saudiphocaensis TaxID=1499686 RepID=UPI000F78E45C|nr:LysE family transporter [Pseudomonas saudiphocaensis]RRV17464.1 LysE family translocator [Pseudomonas saudiphocaensis]